MISPFFEELSDNTEGVKFCKVDVDAQLEIAQECGIQAVSSPTRRTTEYHFIIILVPS